MVTVIYLYTSEMQIYDLYLTHVTTYGKEEERLWDETYWLGNSKKKLN